MHIDLDALEAKARAAKAVWRGPWHAAPHCTGTSVDDAGENAAWTVEPADGVLSGRRTSGNGVPKAVAEHTAASDPDTVLMLIHTIKEWR